MTPSIPYEDCSSLTQIIYPTVLISNILKVFYLYTPVIWFNEVRIYMAVFVQFKGFDKTNFLS